MTKKGGSVDGYPMPSRDLILASLRDKKYRPDDTLSEARRVMYELASNSKRGSRCPCCDRVFVLRERLLHSDMSATLIWVARRHREMGEEWVNVPRDAPRSVINNREIEKLIWWDMVEARSKVERGRGNRGYWRVTNVGFDFVDEKIAVPRTVYVLNKEVKDVSTDTIWIKDSLGCRYSYYDLMRFDLGSSVEVDEAKQA